MILVRSDPKRAAQKLSTTNPSTNEATKRKSDALIIKMKIPKARIVTGSVSTISTGRTSTLRTPSTSAAIHAVRKLSI